MLAPAPVGGLETVVTSLASAQRRAGHNVIVVPTLSSVDDGRDFLAVCSDESIKVEPLVVRGRRYFRERRLLYQLCRREGADLVHTHGYRSDIIGGLAGRKAGVPIVTTVHGFAGTGWRDHRYEAMQRFAFRRFDAVVVVSRPLATQLLASGVSATRLHTVPNALAPTQAPVDRESARQALGLPPNAIVAGWVGRISREKGIDVFIDALSTLANTDIHAAVLGDGPERASEQRRAQTLVPDRISWLGSVPNAARYFAAFDLFVLSSHSEGLPMVLLEAMAAGIPIVTTSVGGIPDLLSPAEATLVAPNDPAALADAIRATITNPTAARARAAAAQRRQRESFAVGPWSERYESIYRSLLDARSRSSARA